MPSRLSPNSLYRLAARAFALLMRLLPWKRRLRAAVALVRLYTRFVPFKDAPDRYRIDGPLELRLIRMLDVLTRYGCTFEADLDVEGREHVQAAVASGRAILIVGPHAMLNFLVHRYLYDQGVNALAPATQTDFFILGTTVPARTTKPGPGSLLRLWQELRRGGAVAALIDRRPGSGLPLEVETPRGRAGIDQSLFRVAERTNAFVLFMSAHVTGRGTVCVRFESPVARMDVLRERFVAFMQAHVAATAA